MKLLLVALFGLFALIGAYWLTLLPWLTTTLFARLWWRQRGLSEAYLAGYMEKIVNPTPTRRRKRGTR